MSRDVTRPKMTLSETSWIQALFVKYKSPNLSFNDNVVQAFLSVQRVIPPILGGRRNKQTKCFLDLAPSPTLLSCISSDSRPSLQFSVSPMLTHVLLLRTH